VDLENGHLNGGKAHHQMLLTLAVFLSSQQKLVDTLIVFCLDTWGSMPSLFPPFFDLV
jgi:hypothetical protein